MVFIKRTVSLETVPEVPVGVGCAENSRPTDKIESMSPAQMLNNLPKTFGVEALA